MRCCSISAAWCWTLTSQVTVLSVPPDIAPLVVASVGLLCGSIPGAIMGFAMGLMVDTALLQTLGVNSLIYLSIVGCDDIELASQGGIGPGSQRRRRSGCR